MKVLSAQSRFQPPTKCPDKVVLGSGSQHGQVQIDHLSIKRRVGDEVIVDVSLHWENLTHRQKHQQAEEGGGDLMYDLHLWRNRVFIQVQYVLNSVSNHEQKKKWTTLLNLNISKANVLNVLSV